MNGKNYPAARCINYINTLYTQHTDVTDLENPAINIKINHAEGNKIVSLGLTFPREESNNAP